MIASSRQRRRIVPALALITCAWPAALLFCAESALAQVGAPMQLTPTQAPPTAQAPPPAQAPAPIDDGLTQELTPPPAPIAVAPLDAPRPDSMGLVDEHGGGFPDTLWQNTDPEIAHVGLSGGQAEERGLAVDTLVRPLSDVDRAVVDNEEQGFVKVHLRKGTDKIVGATIVARHAGEMIGELTLAISAGIGVGRLASVIHPYPTQAEGIRQVGDMYNRTRLTPTVKRLFAAWLRWTR